MREETRAALGRLRWHQLHDNDELMRGDVKKLKGRPNQFRLRVGDYRVVFTPDHKTRTIAVLEIFHRGRGY